LKSISIDNDNREFIKKLDYLYSRDSNIKDLIKDTFSILDECFTQNLTRKGILNLEYYFDKHIKDVNMYKDYMDNYINDTVNQIKEDIEFEKWKDMDEDEDLHL